MPKINEVKLKHFLYNRKRKGKKIWKFSKLQYVIHVIGKRFIVELKEFPKNFLKLLWFFTKVFIGLVVVGFVFCISYPLTNLVGFDEFIINPTWEFFKSEILLDPWNIGWFILYFALLGLVFMIAFKLFPKFMDWTIEWSTSDLNVDMTEEEIEEEEKRINELLKNTTLDDFIDKK